MKPRYPSLDPLKCHGSLNREGLWAYLLHPPASGDQQTVKLARTHTAHLAGTRFLSSKSPRLTIRRLHQAMRFRKIFEKTLGRVADSLASEKGTTSFSINLSRRLVPIQGNQPDHRVFPNDPWPHTGADEDFSVSTEPRPGARFERLIGEASRTYGVKKNLIRAVIKAESGFDPKAKSKSGAVGLMQLLPSTGKDLGVTDLYDPRENIFGGTRYLAMLLGRYKGNVELALAAYNWGPGNLERTPRRLPRETREYIQRVLKYLEISAA